jgi:hypothetical protein
MIMGNGILAIRSLPIQTVGATGSARFLGKPDIVRCAVPLLIPVSPTI